MLTAQYKRSGSLNSGFLSCNRVSTCHLTFCVLPCGDWGLRTSVKKKKKKITLWLLVLLWVINFPLFLTQRFHISCQHPWNCGQLTDWLAKSKNLKLFIGLEIFYGMSWYCMYLQEKLFLSIVQDLIAKITIIKYCLFHFFFF